MSFAQTAEKSKTAETQQIGAVARPWSVFDNNARQRSKTGEPIPRIHEAGGREYHLFWDRPTEMPEAHARQFLRDAAFKVLDPDGNEVQNLSEVQRQREAPVKLDPDMVVANLTELTKEALVTRAAMLPGGDQMDALSTREELIAFVKRAQRNMEILNTSSERLPDGRSLSPEQRAEMLQRGIGRGDPDEFSADQLERVLPASDADMRFA